MKVRTWIDVEQAEGDLVSMILDCVSSVHRALVHIPGAKIAAMTERQRDIIANALQEQARRFEAAALPSSAQFPERA